MTKAMPRRKPAAILAADVIGFRKLMGESEDRTLQQRRYVQADPGIRFDGYQKKPAVPASTLAPSPVALPGCS